VQAAFSAAIDAIFRDANVAEDALWRSGGTGDGVPVRVVRKSPDEIVGFGASRAVMPTCLVDVRVSEVATPESGDSFEIGEAVFDVTGSPRRDTLGLVWVCEVLERG
jgi:hypothetical protein